MNPLVETVLGGRDFGWFCKKKMEARPPSHSHQDPRSRGSLRFRPVPRQSWRREGTVPETACLEGEYMISHRNGCG
jgi:hypothetical protein